MTTKIRTTILALLIATAMCWTTSQALADVYSAVEPPLEDWPDSVWPFYNRPDGTPDDTLFQNPCEIFGMEVETLGDGRVAFEIETNFGDSASRAAYDSAHADWLWGDSYSDGMGMQNIAAGDLYIRVHTPGDVDNSGDRIYGLVFEGRTGTSADLWGDPMLAAGYGSGATYDVAKEAGQLWQLTGDAGFATGTYEPYAWEFENELPEMEAAQELPGLLDTTWWGLRNAYPTLLLGGTQVGLGSVDWNDADKTWTGEFELASINEGDVVEVWWTMACGNDAVMIGGMTGARPQIIPVPGTLLLCGIGIGCIALVRHFRRK